MVPLPSSVGGMEWKFWKIALTFLTHLHPYQSQWLLRRLNMAALLHPKTRRTSSCSWIWRRERRSRRGIRVWADAGFRVEGPGTMGCGRCCVVFTGKLSGCNRTLSHEAGEKCSGYGAMEAGSAFPFNLTVSILVHHSIETCFFLHQNIRN